MGSTEVQLPSQAAEKLKLLIQRKEIAEMELQRFLDGCLAGMGLDGDWDLDLQTWHLVPRGRRDSSTEASGGSSTEASGG